MNNFSFTGRLTQDAEIHATASGLSILKFSVANNTGYGDKQKTSFINCALFGKRAEGKLKDYLKKGQEVAVSGELNLNKYTRNDGQQGASLECNVNGVDMIGGRNSQTGQAGMTEPPQQETSKLLPPDDFDDIPF
jgi:single-strand DNA-binding protein